MFTLPKTELLVHPLCLGANTFGWSADEAQSFAVLDAYVAAGGNFIDTADVYSEWKEGNTGGESETIIGKWMKARNNRNKIVLATKVAKLSTRRGLSPANITAALDDSLRRLQTDYVDIYYSHEDDLKVPTEDTLGKYTELINAGKIRYIAASQHSGARLQHALDTAKANNLASYIALQDHYNLMTRNPFESEQQAVVHKKRFIRSSFLRSCKRFSHRQISPRHHSRICSRRSRKGIHDTNWLGNNRCTRCHRKKSRCINVCSCPCLASIKSICQRTNCKCSHSRTIIRNYSNSETKPSEEVEQLNTASR